MNCPKCNNKIDGNFCKTCDKDLKIIYLKLAEDYQTKREYAKAIEYLNCSLNYIDSIEEITEVKDQIRCIEFSVFNDSEEIDDELNIIIKEKNEDYIYSGFKKLILITFICIILFGSIEYGKKWYVHNKKIPDTVIGNRVLNTALLFHLNQNISSNADIADKASYYRLLKILRKHKNLKFNIHISGTLIQSLLWYSPETIELIKDGLKDGQFELLGSTYSQNIIYSTDDISNRWQIERHLEIINDVFNYKPIGFWNPERTWTNSISDLILNYGYKYTFIENNILKKSGTNFDEHVIRTFKNNLVVINDDYEFISLINNAIDEGDYELNRENQGANLSKRAPSYKNLFSYIRKIYEKDSDSTYLLNYAEDAEAFGLWDLRDGYTPEYDFKNLDFLLSEINSKKWINLVKYSEIINNNAVENLESIEDGTAKWMNKAAMGIGNYSEKGYKGWFDFNQHSPKLDYYRKQHIKYQNMILNIKNTENKAVKNLKKLAKDVFMARQYEFGCTGISGTDEEWSYNTKYETWENIKLVNIIIEVINSINNYSESIYEKDINNDGIKEIIVVNNHNFYVFSKSRGGRLLYWYDMMKGIEIVGGTLAVNTNYPYYDDNVLFFNTNYKNNLRFINPEPELYTYLEKVKLNIKIKALNEIGHLYKSENKNRYEFDNFYNYEINYKIIEDEDNNKELLFYTDSFKKIISFSKTGLTINYEYNNNIIEYLEVFSEFQPGYHSIANHGKSILENKFEDDFISIYNIIDNIGLNIYVDNIYKPTEIEESFMGILSKIYLKNNGQIKIIKY